MELTRDKKQLCDIQGRLFVLARNSGCDCPAFIEMFMNSRTAECLDDTYDRLQWAGEEYLLEELEEEQNGFKKAGEVYDTEVMYWAGYIYRWWHYFTGEPSRRIYSEANADDMNASWEGFHTMDVEMAVANLKEIAQLRKGQCQQEYP